MQQQQEGALGWRNPSMACDPGVDQGALAMDYEGRDACGVGFVAQPGRRTHDVLQRALRALGCMEVGR